MARAEFDALVEQAMAAGEYAHMRPVIEKELLHYDILHCLDRHRLLDPLVFQGGTCLRLIHGAPRFSEDLDFVGGTDFSPDDLQNLKACIEQDIGQRYGLEVIVKPPRALKQEPDNRDVRVEKWQISVITARRRPDIPRQRIKLEVAAIPAWTREVQALRRNYDFLPDGFEDILVPTESLEEIMADKLVSLINCRRFVRYRDIWDLRWLAQQGAVPNECCSNTKSKTTTSSNGPNGPRTCADNYPRSFMERHFAKRLTASFRSTFRPAPWNEKDSLST